MSLNEQELETKFRPTLGATMYFGGVADLSPHAHEIALGKCIQLKN